MTTAANLKDTLKAIDSKLEEYKTDIENGEKLKRLIANSDFQDLILDGYCESEAKKLFQILTDPTGASPYSNEDIHFRLGYISNFKGYVGTSNHAGTIENKAIMAPDLIIKETNYRKEVTADFAEEE